MMVNNPEYDTLITNKRIYIIMKNYEHTRFNVLARNDVPLRLAIDG